MTAGKQRDRREQRHAGLSSVNAPNTLTVTRILLVPVVLLALLAGTREGMIIGGVVFALAALTDILDGYLARSRSTVTTFGRVMDSVADKLLITAALIGLVSLDRLAAWVALVIVGREFAVTALRYFAARQAIEVSVSRLGKMKTLVQVLAILALIAVGPAVWAQVLVYAAVAITVVSGADYFWGFRREVRGARLPAAPSSAHQAAGGRAPTPP